MRALSVAQAGSWRPALEVGHIAADFEQRFRRRVLFATVAGWEFLLDLAQPTRLRDGDGLVLEDGTIVRVEALAEPLAEITTFDDRGLVRIAWHLGNRHLPVQIARHTLRIRAEPVTLDLVERLGGSVHRLSAPFDPEPGAYEHS